MIKHLNVIFFVVTLAFGTLAPNFVSAQSCSWDSDPDLEELIAGGGCDADLDCDCVTDTIDNCRETRNREQRDTDRDGVGDFCDDSDGDGLFDSEDSCRTISNFGDPEGSACADSDGDGILDSLDNCADDYNSSQRDFDRDGIGDRCDNCRFVSNEDQLDSDDDGFGDVCVRDLDGDGVADSRDNCRSVQNADQADGNGNDIGDACESFATSLSEDVDTPPAERPAFANMSESCSLVSAASASPLGALLLALHAGWLFRRRKK